MSTETIQPPVPKPSTDAPGPKKLFKMVYKFLLLSFVVHLIGLAIFGGAIIMKKLQPEEVIFEAPPPIVRVEPKKRQYKLRVQQQKKRSSRPVLQQRLQSTRMSNVALPDMKSNIAPLKSKVAKVPGLSEGFGGGMGFGGGTGMGNVFGVNIKANHLGVLLDVSFSTHQTIHLAVAEIQKSFPMAVIVLVPGCGMLQVEGNAKIMTAKGYHQKRASLRTPAGYDQEKFLYSGRTDKKGLLWGNAEFKALFDKTSESGNLFCLHTPYRNNKTGALVGGTQVAVDFLIGDGVDAIYWFADFHDPIEKPIATRLISDLRKNNIKVYQQVLKTSTKPAASHFDFAKQTGGRVIKTQ